MAGGQQLGALAGQQQQLGLADVNALATLGGQQQQIQQAQQLFPLQTLGNVSQLIKGYSVPTDVSSSYKGPLPGAYSSSPLSQISGLGALLGANIGGGSSGSSTVGSAILGGLSSGWDWLRNKFSTPAG